MGIEIMTAFDEPARNVFVDTANADTERLGYILDRLALKLAHDEHTPALRRQLRHGSDQQHQFLFGREAVIRPRLALILQDG